VKYLLDTCVVSELARERLDKAQEMGRDSGKNRTAMENNACHGQLDCGDKVNT